MAETSPERRVIAHMDCDAFYASVELMRRPELRGRPVVVAGTGPRAVVTTASYEARRFGIGSAMAAARARRLCPEAIFVPPDFDAYRTTSRAVWAVARDALACGLQQCSLDEAYADVTHLDMPIRTLRELVGAVRDETGITLSVGIGPSRLVAKTASDADKPAGFTVLSREQACERFAASATRLLHGVGPKTADRLAELGINTVADLRAAAQSSLAGHFGERQAHFLASRAHFRDSSAVETTGTLKSRSSETTFDTDIADLATLEATLTRLAADVCDGLTKRDIRGRTIGIKVRLDDWTNATRARTIDRFVNDDPTVTAIALELLREYAPPRPVRLLGVRVASFEHELGEAAVEATPPRVAAGQLMFPL